MRPNLVLQSCINVGDRSLNAGGGLVDEQAFARRVGLPH